MSDVFLSHAEPDASVALELAKALEGEGYSTWYYERDSLPGLSYLIQTAAAIEESRVVLLLISPQSVSSHQVTKEVVRAHEAGKPFIPVLNGITHGDFQLRQPEWREALGAHTSVSLGGAGVGEILPRLLAGLRALGVQPAGEVSSHRSPESSAMATPPFPVARGSDPPGDGAWPAGDASSPAWMKTIIITPDTRERLLDVIELIGNQLRAQGHEDEVIYDAEFVCRELVENALEHGLGSHQGSEQGQPGQPEPRVKLEVRISANYFKCVVEDSGPGFDVQEVLDRAEREASDPSRLRGRGLLMIKRRADRLEFDPTGTRIQATISGGRFRGRVTGSEKTDLTVFEVEGTVDGSAMDRVREGLERALEDRPGSPVVLDLTRCSSLPSAGIGLLLMVRGRVGEGGPLILVGVSARVRSQLEIVRVDTFFRFADTLEDARALLGNVDPSQSHQDSVGGR